MKDELGTRMKTYYEDRFRYKLLRRSYTVVRIDGKGFSKYTKGLERPFDNFLIADMNEAAKYVCANVQNVKCAYVQSDEMSFLLTDFDDLNTQMYFDGNIQKIVSVMSSYATSKFNLERFKRVFRRDDHLREQFSPINVMTYLDNTKLAQFDARVFQLPNRIETINYFRWRIQDCRRNSVSSVAQAKFSHKELDEKSTLQKLEMLKGVGVDWEALEWDLKDGRGIFQSESYIDGVTRKKWAVMPFNEEWIP